jgi:dTMP kinase
MARGKFIVFEGIDGSGKGTQICKALAYILEASKANDVYITREPTRTFLEIRRAMAASRNVRSNAHCFAEMFVKDRWNHIQQHIEPALRTGTHVLCDRYKYSTFAYQTTQGIDLSSLVEMHEGMLVPDMVLFIDCAADVSFQRRAGTATDVFEKNLEFQRALRQKYLELATDPRVAADNIRIINGMQSVEAVAEEITRHLREIIPSESQVSRPC